METAQSLPLTDLPRDATLRVRDGRERVVAVFEGQVWLTQQGDSHDFILNAGESVTLDRPGLTVVQGLRDARIMVLEPDADVARLPSTHELYHQARAHRAAFIGSVVAAGWARLKRAAFGSRERSANRRAPHAGRVAPFPRACAAH